MAQRSDWSKDNEQKFFGSVQKRFITLDHDRVFLMRLVSRHGRLRIQMRILYLGQDLVVLISGGEAHLGAAAMGIVGHSVTTGLLLVPGHREDVLAQETADRMSKVLGFNVIVAAGIHYDNITPEEIRQIQTMVHHLTERCLAALTGGKAC